MKVLKNTGFILIGLVLIWFAGGRHPGLLEQRQAYHLTAGEPLEQTTPLVAFTTVALGGFRGIIADALWLRTSRLQEEGKYFEVVQLANWITKLEPRFPEVWSYQAWNMVYNISMLFIQPEDRWRWVYHGIQLIRDEGIKHNPAEASLYWQLAWFFQHKIGFDLDATHAYFKQQWARNMQQVLGGLRPDYAALKQIPANREALLKTPGMPELLEALRENKTPPFRTGWLAEAPTQPEVQQILDRHPAPAAALLEYLRAQDLRTIYKMDADQMQALEKKYTQLDWRSPFTHAIYWAHRGQQRAKGFERIRLHLMIFQSFRYNFKQGRILYNRESGIVGFAADLSMLEPALFAYDEALKEHPDHRPFIKYHQDFMVYAIGMLYRHQEMDRARQLLERLRRQYPSPFWKQDLEEMIHASQVMQMAQTLAPKETLPRITDEIEQYFIWSKFGESRRAAGHLAIAQRIYGELKKTAPEVPPFETLQQTAAKQAEEVLSRQRILP